MNGRLVVLLIAAGILAVAAIALVGAHFTGTPVLRESPATPTPVVAAQPGPSNSSAMLSYAS